MPWQHINKPIPSISPIITRSYIQDSTYASYLVADHSPFHTTPVSERSTENLFTLPKNGVFTFEQWKKNANDIVARVN